MKKSLFLFKYSLLIVLLAFLSLVSFSKGIYAQTLSPEPSFTPNPTPNASSSNPSPTPLPSISSTPVPTTQSTAVPTPIPTSPPQQTPSPAATPQPVIPVVIEDNNSGGGGRIFDDEDLSDSVTIIPIPQVINQFREQSNPDPIFEDENESEEVVSLQQQTPGEIISPIIPREFLNRIIPTGLYKEDGLHPIDGLILLIFGVGFIISGISLLRSDVFLPALSDIGSLFKSPHRKRWINNY